MAINFKEIPQANLGDGLQDTFELFARDFLEMMGYGIVQHPHRGSDGKKDLIVEELRAGLSGTTRIKWLVSCKHYAHSGKSISDADEPNILDRVSVHNCAGFLGFYSTLPATSLASNIEGLKEKINTQTFDHRQIEKILLESRKGFTLASRYFPTSCQEFVIENPKPAKIFHDDLGIFCEHCDTNLLAEKKGIMVILRRYTDFSSAEYKRQPYEAVYFSCKGKCDHILKNYYNQQGPFVDVWVDIPDFLFPTGYIKKVMAWLNSLNSQEESLAPEALEKVKKLFLNAFPYVARELTTKEKEHVSYFLKNGIDEFL